jgi:predicted kinase
MLKKLYLMCGPAGSGKTTWVKQHAHPGVSAHISRDRIRFSMVRENENYFSREDEVFEEFCEQIKQALAAPWVDEVYVDATHLTAKAREKVLREIAHIKFELIAVVIEPPLEKVLEQNAKRTGRERVPDTVIKNMYNSFEHPSLTERYVYQQIIKGG